jgi:hypothetical protein
MEISQVYPYGTLRWSRHGLGGLTSADGMRLPPFTRSPYRKLEGVVENRSVLPTFLKRTEKQSQVSRKLRSFLDRLDGGA